MKQKVLSAHYLDVVHRSKSYEEYANHWRPGFLHFSLGILIDIKAILGVELPSHMILGFSLGLHICGLGSFVASVAACGWFVMLSAAGGS